MTIEQSDDQPRRRHPAHGVILLPDQPTIVFLTVCTKDRVQWLASPDIHDLLRSVWTNAAAWLVGRYVVMPDHIHLFAAPGTPELPLENWVTYWKSQFTKQHRLQNVGGKPIIGIHVSAVVSRMKRSGSTCSTTQSGMGW